MKSLTIRKASGFPFLRYARLVKPKPRVIDYPDSDGEPPAQNPKQYNIIVTLETNISHLYAADESVWIGKDQFWYPVENSTQITQAPDVFVVFGRSKIYRPVYKQWEEGNVPPQVVIEVLSPKNTRLEMIRKLAFYERYGAEEYIILDPDFRIEKTGIGVYLRTQRGILARQTLNTPDFVSPRLQVRFTAEKQKKDLCFYYPNGRPFEPADGLISRMFRREQEKEAALRETAEARKEEARALQEAEEERTAKETALQEAEAARTEKEEMARKLAYLAKLLRDAGVEPDKIL